jgi:hypothetical protein
VVKPLPTFPWRSLTSAVILRDRRGACKQLEVRPKTFDLLALALLLGKLPIATAADKEQIAVQKLLVGGFFVYAGSCER